MGCNWSIYKNLKTWDVLDESGRRQSVVGRG